MSAPRAFLIVPLYATEDREPPCDGTETVSMLPDGRERLACEAHYLYDTDDTHAYPRPGIVWGNVERAVFLSARDFDAAVDWRSLRLSLIGEPTDDPMRDLLALRP